MQCAAYRRAPALPASRRCLGAAGIRAAARRLSSVRSRAAADVSAAAPPAPTAQDGDNEPSTSGYDDSDLYPTLTLNDSIRQRNREFAERIKGKLILAPLTKGGNVPFRRLCVDFGGPDTVTMSEMAFTKPLLKGDKVERARLYKAKNEGCYGFQVATKTITDGIAAAKLAKEAGATWMDINCGCPIYEAMSKGMGAALLRKPRALAKMVNGIVNESELPITVKIRLGENDKKINVDRVVSLLTAAGAAAVTVHGRTMEQRYKKAADWGMIQSVATHESAPIIGNGDILTHYEAQQRAQSYGTHALMVGRGALIRPWIFQEYREGRELGLTAVERVGVYRKLVAYMKEHFGDDALGKRKAWYFFPWHFSFFHRYRHLPQDVYGDMSTQHPLILTRMDLHDPRLGEASPDDLPLLERLLRAENEGAHAAIADALWEAGSDADAVSALERIGLDQVRAWEAEVRESGREAGDASRGGGLGVGGGGGRERDDDRDREGGGGGKKKRRGGGGGGTELERG